MRFLVIGYDLHGRVRLVRDTLVGAEKKAQELIAAKFFDVAIENPDGSITVVKFSPHIIRGRSS